MMTKRFAGWRAAAAAALCVAALGCFGAIAPRVFAQAPAVASGPPLSLEGYHVTFDDAFSSLSISPHGPGTRWIAHTPWHGDFGNAQFSDPDSGVFSAGRDGLTITAFKGADGKWRSGLISSLANYRDLSSGFTQRYGYFEIEAKLPGGMGTWPAFWLMGFNKGHYWTEIDVIEFYGGWPALFHSAVHVWGEAHKGQHRLTAVPTGQLSSQFNRFGVLITPQTVSFYLNRQLFWSIPTLPEYRQPMYILADLALGGGWPLSGVHSPVTMQVHYIKVWQRDAPWP